MTDIQDQIELQTPPPAGESKPPFLSVVKKALSRLFGEIRSKKFFKIFAVLIAIILFVAVVGAVFSIFKNKAVSIPQTSPTPQSTQEIKEPEASETETKLKVLKDRVFGLEVYQRRLSPPVFDFKISF